MYVHYMSGTGRDQKKASGPLVLEIQMAVNHHVCVCWESNPCPLKEHQVLLVIKPFLQPLALSSLSSYLTLTSTRSYGLCHHPQSTNKSPPTTNCETASCCLEVREQPTAR